MTQSISAMFGSSSAEAWPAGSIRACRREDEVYVLLRDADIRPHHRTPTRRIRSPAGYGVPLRTRCSAEGVFLQLLCLRTKGQRSIPDRASAGTVRQLLSFPRSPPNCRPPTGEEARNPGLVWPEGRLDTRIPVGSPCRTIGRRISSGKDFPLGNRVAAPLRGRTPQSTGRLFGEGVLQVPVGPVHAGIIEPGHFNFAVGRVNPSLSATANVLHHKRAGKKLFEKEFPTTKPFS